MDIMDTTTFNSSMYQVIICKDSFHLRIVLNIAEILLAGLLRKQ